MAERKPHLMDFKKLAELLVKEEGIHDGFWGVCVRFGLKATNFNFQQPEGGGTTLLPTALIPILEIGIQPFPEANTLTVDASTVNPRKKRQGGKPSPKKAKKR